MGVKTFNVKCKDLIKLFLYPQEVSDFPYNKVIKTIAVSDHHKDLHLFNKIIPWNGWIFRGHMSSSWTLSSTLERNLNLFNIEKNQYFKKEQALLREFQRSYYQYSSHIPDGDDYYEWISIMQHLGAPTRFVDFTYSPFVAIFLL